jgi:hypothetical protein
MGFIENINSAAYNIILQTVKCFHEMVISDIIIDKIGFQRKQHEFGNIINLLGMKVTGITTNTKVCSIKFDFTID